ncbi:MAG: hypothetical protein KTQ49_01625 [Candidatus Omnitrophica bacterium]|nr:hypothetical protein [Candidatus Omnitrophota bacterium]
MKRLLPVLLMAAALFSGTPGVLYAVEGEMTGTAVRNTPQDVSDIEQTLRRQKIDLLERRVADLEQANRFLTQRMQDLERTVYDFKSRT